MAGVQLMLVWPAQPGRAGRLLRVKVDAEVLRREAGVGAGLPVGVGSGGANQVDAVALRAGDEQGGVEGAGVHDVRGGEEVTPLERVVDDRRRGRIHDGTGARGHVGDEAGHVVLARFGEMHLVADPGGRLFARVVGVAVVGRTDVQR